LGAAFLRAARFNFFRSCLSSILVVSATGSSFAQISSGFPVDRVNVTLRITGFARRRKRRRRVKTGIATVSGVQ
jgi:hypothetical protein